LRGHETWKNRKRVAHLRENLTNISKTITNEHGSNRLGRRQNAKCQRAISIIKEA